jgi:hypothetical protein
MELNDHENYALSLFCTLINNNTCKEKLVNYMISTEEDLGNTKNINWIKVAEKLNSKRMIEAFHEKECLVH